MCPVKALRLAGGHLSHNCQLCLVGTELLIYESTFIFLLRMKPESDFTLVDDGASRYPVRTKDLEQWVHENGWVDDTNASKSCRDVVEMQYSGFVERLEFSRMRVVFVPTPPSHRRFTRLSNAHV